jgi:glycosyltransferase involved in cell wall biosynthesis
VKILLATGIYPPDIGGPATYVVRLADALTERGHEVKVVTYGKADSGQWVVGSDAVIRVSKIGGIVSRWCRYAKALTQHGKDADAVIVFTSVSAGIPLIMSGLKKPKKILRLGGDFFWERYTDAGGTKSLRRWYRRCFGFWKLMNNLFMEAILRSFDTIVYSTAFQRQIHSESYKNLPSVVITNARPHAAFFEHVAHQPCRLLFMGRFVHFKNIHSLIGAMVQLPHATLTIVGDGPLKKEFAAQIKRLQLQSRVTLKDPVFGKDKSAVFAEHDLLVLPSVTEISPNVALEAASEGLPVLLTQETGIAPCSVITLSALCLPDDIAAAVRARFDQYRSVPCDAKPRSYNDVADDFLKILS